MALGVGVGRSDAVARSSAGGPGVFSGFGVSSSFRADLDFPAFLVLREISFSWDFFDFGFGVGVWRRFDFGEALDSGVSRGVGRGVATSSSWSDFFVNFALRGRGDSCASGDSLSSLFDSSFAGFALGIGVGDFFSFREGSVFSCDSWFANFAWGIAVAAFSGVAEARCFFPDLSLDVFVTGLGDFFGFGDGESAICSDASRRLFSSSPTCAWRRLPTIAPETSTAASQMRKRTTATERNRARDAINGIVKKS
jgi:hypothetical protein